MDCRLPGFSVHEDFPGKNTAVGCQALLQGIFPTQGSNPARSPTPLADSLPSEPPGKSLLLSTLDLSRSKILITRKICEIWRQVSLRLSKNMKAIPLQSPVITIILTISQVEISNISQTNTCQNAYTNEFISLNLISFSISYKQNSKNILCSKPATICHLWTYSFG